MQLMKRSSGQNNGGGEGEGGEGVDIDGGDGGGTTESPKSRNMLAGSASLIKDVGSYFTSIKFVVLVVLCLQNSIFTVLRRYSQGTLQEKYSSHEVLLVAELIKIGYCYLQIHFAGRRREYGQVSAPSRILYLLRRSSKMLALAVLYGAMNILSFVALRNVSAGPFAVLAQLKILTTAACSSLLLGRRYTPAQWRALLQLTLGVLLFSAPLFEKGGGASAGGNAALGTAAVLTEVTLSGFASIYFEKVIKTDPETLSIWERNLQLAFWSLPVYALFLLQSDAHHALGSHWSPVAIALSCLGAAGGLLVALSIRYGDSVLKTLATAGSIVLSSLLDHCLLTGPLTFVMAVSGAVVILAICNYTFDATPPTVTPAVVVVSPRLSPLHAKDFETAASTTTHLPTIIKDV